MTPLPKRDQQDLAKEAADFPLFIRYLQWGYKARVYWINNRERLLRERANKSYRYPPSPGGMGMTGEARGAVPDPFPAEEQAEYDEMLGERPTRGSALRNYWARYNARRKEMPGG